MSIASHPNSSTIEFAKSRREVPPKSAPAKRVVVNAAFLQEIKDSNPEYWHSIQQVQDDCSCQEDAHPLCRKLVKHLDELRDVAALQFSLEESYGYQSIIIDHAQAAQPPSPMHDLAATTHADHSRLYLKLSELAEQAEELQYRGVALAGLRDLIDRVVAFNQALAQHENDEQRLMEQQS